MNPQTTDRITADTNVEVLRIVERDNYVLTRDDIFDFTLITEKDYNFLPVAGNYFSVDAYFNFVDSGGNRLYKGVYASNVNQNDSAFFYYYSTGTYLRVGMSAASTTYPTVNWRGFILIYSTNQIQ